MNILDIVLICLIVLTAIIGFSKGFINTLLSFVGNLASLVASFFLAKPLAGLLNSWFGLSKTISGSLTSQISTFFTEFANANGATVLENHCNATGILKSALSYFIKPETVYESNTVLSSSLGELAGNFVTMAICMIIAFILIKLAVYFLAKIFDSLKKKSLAFSGLDRVLGLVLGVLKGLVFVAVVFIIASMIQTIPTVANFLDTVFEGSSIGKPLYDFLTTHVNEYLSTIDFNTLLAI